MKALLMLLVVVVVALVAFNYLTTGELKLLPGGETSDEARELDQLQGEFRAAAREYRQAARSVAVSGIDASDAGAAALASVDRVEKDVRAFAKRTTSVELKAKANKLLDEIQQYKHDVGG
jgi:hypothetical protein